MIHKLLDFCRTNKLIQQNDQILVGVSGGVDSVGLLYFFSQIQQEYHLNLHCIYVEHGLRGQASVEDGEFVKCLANQLKIGFSQRSYDVLALSQSQGIGIEEMARIKRYEAYLDVMNEIGYQKGKLALGHHKKDQVETILFYMARGTSIAGMKGMQASSIGLKGLHIIRPFLTLTKKEIYQYVTEHHLAYREDSTNSDIIYRRNLIRHKMIPCLRKVNEKAEDHILELSQDIKEMEDYVLNGLAIDWERIKRTGSIKVEEVIHLPSVVGMSVFKKALELMKFSLKDISRVHFRMLIELASNSTGKQVSLPNGLVVYKSQGYLFFGDRKKIENKSYDILEYMNQCIDLENYRLHFSQKNHEEIKNYDNDNCLFYFPYDMIDKSIKLRICSPKDYIQIYEDGRRQSLKKLYKNAKIAHQNRQNQWVIAKEDEVLLAIGLRRSQGYQVKQYHQMVWVVEVERLHL